MIFAFWAQIKVNSTFHKYSRETTRSGLTAAEAARRMLNACDLYDVNISQVPGELSDHYDPRDRTLYLSQSVFAARSAAAIGVACHEAGHAIQHARGYAPLRARMSIIPLCNIGSRAAFPLFFIGLLFGYLYVRSGSLRRTWLLHALVNFFGGVVGPLVSRLMLGIELPDPQQAEDFMAAFGQALPAFVVSMLYVILCLGMAVAGVVLWVRELKKAKDRPLQADTEGLSRRQVVLCALFNVGTLAAVAGTLYMMLINLN